MTRHKRRLCLPVSLAGLAIGAVLLTGCSPSSQPAPSPSTPASPSAGTSATPTPTSATSPASTGSGSPQPSLPPEPTTTNTLPPPPEPTAPAPKSAGPLTAKDLPVPAGWQQVVRAGGAEEGYRGNGTWVHGRDPRYAAQDTITVGCAGITRDDYPDPIAALEGSYGKRGATGSRPGVGLIMQFRSSADAQHYFSQYLTQIKACTDPDAQTYAKITTTTEHSVIDQRTYDGSTDWTEIAAVQGNRATFIILTDPGHKINNKEAEAVLAKIKS
ncbi:hypothetical protein FOE78_01300 [Microlunatus elymi]|uniref:PknH-like extracellular domain-containing protein n=1 Tax=Microlunatus elymi TaxID=2596828 RepID=A0A516PUA0_9ACTN|nr:hypothetical protein [Microlunatus elymi]QDP94733.1 hypothetical protein FOE78_01300 [Microlunatus elymi]